MKWGQNARPLQITSAQRCLIDKLLETSLRRGFYKLRRHPGIVFGSVGWQDIPRGVKTVPQRTRQQ